MRKILIGVGVLVIAVIAIITFVFSSLDGLIQEAVEKYGSEITRAEVKLAAVNIDISSGKGGLSGLKVGNPKGFETPSAFNLGEISITIDTGSVTEDPVVIKEIVIAAPEVTYELGSGGSNISAIQKNVDTYMAQFASSGGSAKQDSGEGPKLVIENLYVRGGKLNVSATLLKGKTMSAGLPDIHLKDIGKDKGGATPSEVAEKLLSALNDSATKAASSIGIGKTLDSLKQKMSGATEGVNKAVGEAKGEVGKKLKGLLGN
ncbi:MAG: hypothetical protein H8E36_13800 [Rhodospirillaceae bacterium]|nr:hypothetical protein [Rhodospirillaceae bacterium]